MADTVTASPNAPTAGVIKAKKSPAKKSAAKKTTKVTGVKKPKIPSNHPQYLDMIIKSIQAMKDRKGSSRQAVLKYIMANFNVGNDAKLVNNRIKLAFRRGLKTGQLKQSKGTSGSFRLGDKIGEGKKKTTKPKVVKPKKVASATTPLSAAVGENKKVRKTKPKSPKKPKVAKMQKAKKPAGSPKKPKSTKAPKSAAAKKPKASPKKKVATVKKPKVAKKAAVAATS